VFNAGRIGFDVDRAKAAYGRISLSIVIAYCEPSRRWKVSLAGLRILDEQAQYQATALENANKATLLATARYNKGLVALIDVIDAQRTSLLAQRQALQVLNSQMLATVAL